MILEIDDNSREVKSVTVAYPDKTTRTFSSESFDHRDFEWENAVFYMQDAIRHLKKALKKAASKG
jgi:hypothetical protein